MFVGGVGMSFTVKLTLLRMLTMFQSFVGITVLKLPPIHWAHHCVSEDLRKESIVAKLL